MINISAKDKHTLLRDLSKNILTQYNYILPSIAYYFILVIFRVVSTYVYTTLVLNVCFVMCDVFDSKSCGIMRLFTVGLVDSGRPA